MMSALLPGLNLLFRTDRGLGLLQKAVETRHRRRLQDAAVESNFVNITEVAAPLLVEDHNSA
jgi:hypothetical protein